MNKLKDTLLQIGLTGKEADVYLVLLKIGNTSVGNLIREANVARSKVYEIIERLKEKGLVTESIQNGVRYYETTSTKKLIDSLRKKKQEIEEKIAQTRIALPELESMRSSQAHRQQVKLYVGYPGIQSFFEEIMGEFSAKETYRAITIASTLWNEQATRFFYKFHEMRAQKKVKAEILYAGKPNAFPAEADYSATGLYEIKVINQKIPTGIIIYKDTVAILTWLEPASVVAIHSATISKQYRDFFDDLFSLAKSFH